ncbi:MAG: hypothetical protein B6D57_00740 [Candidatus Coatesbacteria bacterium 4484_99]|uniref:Peptidase M14 domain-containing protein n=1 Tax=Candidatus Coatesbacteria bacterium 4484_99 TaxID=1970774 RepID=A0A1W9S3A7_9BACT|nr:MAG: hypothetical protein B6D57_00740 [Candidatus Coatesbacteria bacterium 4484_99]
MRIFHVLLVVSLLIFGSLSSGDEIVFSVLNVKVNNADDMSTLRHLGCDIDIVKDGWARVYIARDDIYKIGRTGFTYYVLYEDSRDISNWVKVDPDHEKRDPYNLDFTSYHSPESLYDALVELNTNYPDVTRLYQIGTSVEDRPIWALKITDNPDVEEDEPEIRFIGLHHGDEKISVEVPLYFASILLDTYKHISETRELVEEREIWVVPMMNPDGWVRNTRYNANYVDLNRNYSYMWNPDEEPHCGEYPFSEPETCAIRNISANGYDYPNTFALGITCHSGAQCINTPWNYADPPEYPEYSYHPTPDDEVVMEIANRFAEINTTPGFWVTNGCEWYATWGDCNDWSYGERSCIDYTLEISDVKTPPENQIITYCKYNLTSLFFICIASDCGIRGRVTDADTGEPIPANIEVAGIDWTWYNDPLYGDYHRILSEGYYDITASASGYIPQTVYDVYVDDLYAPAERVDFQLEKSVSTSKAIITSNEIKSSVECSLQCYPNPTSGYLNIGINGKLDNLKSIAILDISGRVVRSIDISSGYAEGNKILVGVDLSDLKIDDGVYIICIDMNNKTSYKKIIYTR